jgi:hypothetical protein
MRDVATFPSPPPVKPRNSAWILLVILGIVVGVVAFSLFVRHAKGGIWDRLAVKLTDRTLRIDTSQPTVVEKIQRLQRLETVNYTMDKIVEGERQSQILPAFLTGDRLLLIAHGEVIAGVDLGRLQRDDVQVQGKQIRVRVPEPQVLFTRLDSARTKVYSRSTGLLVAADPNLETEVRQLAEQQLTQAALADGVLEKAKQNARSNVTALLQGLGFEQIDVH